MKLSTPSLLAGVMLSSLFGVANAGEPGARVETPQILGSINVSGYRLLGEAEMAEVVGTLIPNGTYTVYDTLSSGTAVNGTATITSVPGQTGIYTVIYNQTSNSGTGLTSTGLEQGNSLGVVWQSGGVAGLAVYTLNNGQLTGQWIERNAAGSVTNRTQEVLVPRP